jgi:hypothetical protein
MAIPADTGASQPEPRTTIATPQHGQPPIPVGDPPWLSVPFHFVRPGDASRSRPTAGGNAQDLL